MSRTFPGFHYCSAYEAGFSGLGLHRDLSANGFENLVVHPTDVPTSNREKVRMSDNVDSRKFASELMNRTLEGIAIPTVEEENDRGLVRRHGQLVKDVRRAKNRLTQFVLYHGVAVPLEFVSNSWTNRYVDWIAHDMPLQTDYARD